MMAVLINFKICDNAKECGGIAVCPTGALSWSEDKNRIIINNEKCISCGLCEKECPISAIMVAKTQEEYQKFQKVIDEDPRNTKDLFVDRYGASAISDFFQIKFQDIKEKVKKDNITLIELYNPEYAECLLKSIPIKELTKDLPLDTLYYKVECNEIIKEYNVSELPALLIFKDNRLLGTISGYYTNDNKEEVLFKINNILDKIK